MVTRELILLRPIQRFFSRYDGWVHRITSTFFHLKMGSLNFLTKPHANVKKNHSRFH